MIYKIWYNNNISAMWKGYQDTDVLYKVTELHMSPEATTVQTFEKIFRLMNRVDGNASELPDKLECRSMSVGDMIEIESGFYECSRNGWQHRIGYY